MKCPTKDRWHLVASEALTGPEAEELLAHARECAECRAFFDAARRDHIDRVRMYEAFDHDHDTLREQLLAALPAGKPRCSGTDRALRGWYRLGDYAMSLNRTYGRRAAALLIPAAAVLVVALFLTTPGTQKTAFAAAMEHLRAAKSFVSHISMPDGLEVQGMRIQADGMLQFSDEFGSHSELRMNNVVVVQQFAPVQGPMTIVQPATKTWMVLDINQIAVLDATEQSPDAFVRSLRKLTDDGAIELAQETIAGRPAVGYRVPGEKLGIPKPRKPGAAPAYAEVWVDTQTRLPARLLLNMPLWEEGQRLKIVYDQFEWNIPLEASVFAANIPADYVKIDATLAHPTEEALLNTLKQLAFWTGQYPATIGPGSVLGRLHTMIADDKRADFEKLGRDGVIRLGMEISGGTMYFMKLVREGHEPEYFGDEVTPADADKVLLRWRLDDGQMRVVYGDLRVETIPAQK